MENYLLLVPADIMENNMLIVPADLRNLVSPSTVIASKQVSYQPWRAVGPSYAWDMSLETSLGTGFYTEVSQEASWLWLLPGRIRRLDFMRVPAVRPEEQESVKNGLHICYE